MNQPQLLFLIAACLPVPKEVHILGKNLLDASSAKNSWADELWSIESKCDPPPMDLPIMYSATSVMRNQVVDLFQHGFSPSFIEEYKPEIRIRSW